MASTLLSYVKSLILPPGIILLLMLIGSCLLLCQWQKTGKTLLFTGIVILYLLSTPWFVTSILKPLERYTPLNLKQAKGNEQAIVVLTAGSMYSPEYPQGNGPTSHSLLRARYAAALYKKTKLPIIISGGEVGSETMPESTQMERVLNKSFNVPVWKIEPHSKNTYQNAQYTKKILAANHIQHFYLVTSAWHMPRALWAFHSLGLYPVPAGTDYNNPCSILTLFCWLPAAKELRYSELALHEYIGYLWYHLRYE